MQKLARIEPASKLEPVSVSLIAGPYLILINITFRARPNIQAMESRCVLLKNMFTPEEYAALHFVTFFPSPLYYAGKPTQTGTRSSQMMSRVNAK